MKKAARPFEYIVYTNRPAWPYAGCSVRTLRIPRGRHYRDVVDALPPTVGKLAVVRAYSAQSAREYARDTRGIRC